MPDLPEAKGPEPVNTLIREEWWRVERKALEGVWGLCDYEKKTIFLEERAAGLQLLDTTIHEFLHAYFPDVCEEVILKAGTQLASALELVMPELIAKKKPKRIRKTKPKAE